MLTRSTARAALPIRNSSVSAGDQGAGDLAAHGSRVLRKDKDQMYGYTRARINAYHPNAAAIFFQFVSRCWTKIRFQ